MLFRQQRVYTYTNIVDDQGQPKKQLTGIEDYIYTPTGRILALRQTLGGETVQYPDNEGNKREAATFLDGFFGSYKAGVSYDLTEQMAHIAALSKEERLGLQITEGKTVDGKDTITYSRPVIYRTPHLGADTLVIQAVTLQQEQGAWHIIEVMSGYLPASTHRLEIPGQDYFEISYDERGRKKALKEYFYNQEQRRAVPFTESTYTYRPLQLADGQVVEVYDVKQKTYDPNKPDTSPRDPSTFEFVEYVFLRGLKSGPRSFFNVVIAETGWQDEEGKPISQNIQQPKIDSKTGEPMRDEHGEVIKEDIIGLNKLPIPNPAVRSFIRRVTLPNGTTIQARVQLTSEGIIDPNQQLEIRLSE